MTHPHVEALGRIASEVFEKLYSIRIDPARQQQSASSLTTRLEFFGAADGSLEMTAGPDLICRLARRGAGYDEPSPQQQWQAMEAAVRQIGTHFFVAMGKQIHFKPSAGCFPRLDNCEQQLARKAVVPLETGPVELTLFLRPEADL